MIAFTRPEVWQPALLSFIVAALLTPIVRAAARRVGMVAAPKKDRWHSRPTALLGGIAIFLPVAVIGFLQFDTSSPFTRAILPASALMFAIGLVDDIIALKPYQKLVAQIIGASMVAYAGLVLQWTDYGPLNSAITVFWLVGITNAVNMLDNMDGLAAGVSAIAAVFLAVNFFSLGQVVEGTVIAILAAGLCGFLLYNFQPASIFMGDCGSMFIGFFLASTALLTTGFTSGRTRSFLPVIAVPVLTLVIPIFDTTFVTLLRKLSGRAASQGGRDHTSHRLVALGLSERRAVLLLYSLAAIAGVLSTQVRQLAMHESIIAILGFVVVLTLTGVYLAGVKVYSADDAAATNRPIVSFLVDLSYKRRVFETLLDVSLIVIAWYSAWMLRFGRMDPTDPNFLMIVKSLPIVVGIKTAVFLFTGVYRGLWRYTSLRDLVGIAKSTVVASAISAAVLLALYRTHPFSRAVFLMDLVFLLMLMTGSRIAFRVVRRLVTMPRAQTTGRPVLIYGAGDAGELLLREILNNHELGYLPVGFIDDDPKKAGKLIDGLRVYSGETLREVCERLAAQEILLSTSKLPPGRRARIVEACDAMGIPLRQMRIELTTLNSWQSDPMATAEPTVHTTEPLLTVRTHGSTYVVDQSAIVRADVDR
ncbi:MAG TPA: glycosyl transferase [Thermoanaerobaculia bacterium]|nr:glycosyl transferase [Thermoanaerobaculia bacterium]